MSNAAGNLVLHTYFRSSCSARLRIALNLKGIQYESVFVNLLTGEQKSDKYGKINPSGLVPTLQHRQDGASSTNSPVTLTQSLAMLEYLDETYPDSPSLLPPMNEPVERAHVRELANIVACDVQPPTNLRILTRVASLGGNREAWAKELMTEGLIAYERVASQTSGKYSVGDNVTLADVCLVPAVWGAQRFGVDLDALPTVKRLYEALEKLDAVRQAHWKNQEDTPESLRG